MKDLPQGTTQSHLDEIERQIDELYPELYEFVDDGGTQGYVPCGKEVKFLLRTSIISLLEKYGEEIIAVGDPSLNYTQHERFLLAKLEIAQRTKLKEILSSLK